MGKYVPGTSDEQQAMLKAAGYHHWAELFTDVPESVNLVLGNRTGGSVPFSELPEGVGEMEASAHIRELAASNKVYDCIFRGAGSYDHFIPSIVKRVTSNERFLTAYTPYQAEISQGVLQSIFEYQTMICELTGLDVSNASVYDGGTAAAEGAMMCLDRKRKGVLVSETVNPRYRDVVETYCRARNVSFGLVPEKDGVTDIEALKDIAGDDTACVLVQYPNYYGIIEDIESIGAAVHEAGAKYIVSCNPIALGVLKTPGEAGADVAVGEGQPLGLPIAYGGPYLGFMAATEKMMRKLPGRIVGETTDDEGNRAFVLTLHAREQHIKREKAGSNICSNEALCAMTAAVYLSAVGPEGLKNVAMACASKAAYLAKALCGAGLALEGGQAPHFHEFVTVSPEAGGLSACEVSKKILAALSDEGILGGLPLKGGKIIWCATEKNTKEQMDKTAGIIADVLKEIGEVKS